MIDKIKGRYHLICDICGEAAEEVFSTLKNRPKLTENRRADKCSKKQTDSFRGVFRKTFQTFITVEAAQ